MKRRQTDKCLAASSKKLIKSTGRAVSTLPVKVALIEVLRTGKISRETERLLESFSKAVSEAYPAKRVLNSMERAYRGGYTEAALDAMLFCADHGIAPPGWVLKGWAIYERTREDQKGGRPIREAWVNLWRVWAVGKCSNQRYGRSKQGDKYERAARLLRNMNPRVFAGLPVAASAEAIKKSCLHFKRNHRLGYVSYQFLGDALREMLLTPVIEHL